MRFWPFTPEKTIKEIVVAISARSKGLSRMLKTKQMKNLKTYIPPAIEVIESEEPLLIIESKGKKIDGEDYTDQNPPPIRHKGKGANMRAKTVDGEDWTWHNSLWDDDDSSDAWK